MDAPMHCDVASNIELLSAWIEAQMAHRAEPGLSVGIVHDQDLVWARGLDPLAMSDTLVRAPHPDDPRLAVGYGRRLPATGRAVLSPR